MATPDNESTSPSDIGSVARNFHEWAKTRNIKYVIPGACALTARIDETHMVTRAGKLGGPAVQADAEAFAKDVREGHYWNAGLDQLDGMYETIKFGLFHPVASAEARIDEISDEAKLVQKTFNENLKAPAKGKLCK